jgi:DNA-binding winged helix-turn-helix (wHTH) protein
MAATAYLFGACELDVGRRQLVVGGVVRHLSQKAMMLLELLIQNRPSVLSKQKLHDALWPSTFVTESNLAGLAAEIRAALGDDARAPKYIRTVHGYGYSFCGEASEADVSEAGPRRRVIGRLFCGSRELALLEGENVIGREASDARLVIPDATVSRKHAIISVSEERVTITDCRSKNGTFVFGRRVEGSAELTDGCEFRVGSVTLVYRATPPQETITFLGELLPAGD